MRTLLPALCLGLLTTPVVAGGFLALAAPPQAGATMFGAHDARGGAGSTQAVHGAERRSIVFTVALRQMRAIHRAR